MDKKLLLKVSHLKQYFPLKKQLGKEQLFVKANDGISLNIYQGETLGLVGESGCGKSTLGRTLLQLYTQTDGKTIYYGRDLYDIVPQYAKDTFSNLDKYRKKAVESKEKLNEFINEFEKLSQEEKTNKMNEKAQLEKEANHNILDIVQLIGGFFVADSFEEISAAFMKKYDIAYKLHHINTECEKLQICKNAIDGKVIKAKAEGKESPSLVKKSMELSEKLLKLQPEIQSLNTEISKAEEAILSLKATYQKHKEFNHYEEMLDNGIDLARLKYKEMRQLRQDLQLIFQDPYSSLNPRMTVGQIIGEGLLAHNFYEKDDDCMQDYVMQVMEDCGLAPYMIHRYPHQFSGGQRQRIGIARSLAMKPRFVVCDEAVSALDVSIQSQVINLLQDLKEKENLTYLFISHDLSVVKYISDRIGVMYLGNMVELCSAQRIFENPLHPYTEALLLAIPTTDAEGRGNIKPLEGDIPSPIKPPSGCKFHTRCQYCTDICKTVIPSWQEIEPEHFVACHHIVQHKVL